jgi:DNA primase
VEEIQNDELEFQHPVYRKIYETIVDFVQKKMKVDYNYFIMSEDTEISSATADMMTYSYDDQMSKVWSKAEVKLETEEMKLKDIIPELVLSFKNQKLLDMLKETQEDIVKAQNSNDMESITLLIQKMQILNDLKRNIAKKLGDRIILG